MQKEKILYENTKTDRYQKLLINRREKHLENKAPSEKMALQKMMGNNKIYK